MSTTCPNQDDQTAAAAAASSAASTTTTKPHAGTRSVYRRLPKILLLGDSLTQLSWEGWGAHVANIYQRRADVLNRGYGGYNTRFFLRLLPDILRDEQLAPPATTPQTPKPANNNANHEKEVEEIEAEPTVVLTILFFGANDAAIAGIDDQHHVPVNEYQDNLQQMVDIVRQETSCRRFLFVTPPPVHHEQRLAFQIARYGSEKATGVLERTLENTGRYAQACRDVATRLQMPCLDLYHDMQQNDDDWGRFLNDGLHFSKAGHDFVGPAMIRAIHEGFGDELHVVPDPRTGQWCNSASTCPSALLFGGGNNNKKASGGAAGPGPYHDYIDATDPDRAFLEYHHQE